MCLEIIFSVDIETWVGEDTSLVGNTNLSGSGTSLYEMDTPGVLSEFTVTTPTGCGGNCASTSIANASDRTDATFIVRYLGLEVDEVYDCHYRQKKRNQSINTNYQGYQHKHYTLTQISPADKEANARIEDINM